MTKSKMIPLVLLATALVSVPAFAQDRPTAEELTDKAYDAYKKGEYSQALALYQKAYLVSAATPILFNIANIYDRKLHERENAGEYYRRLLRAPDVDPDLVRRANDRLVAMKQEEEQIRKNTAPPAASATSSSTGQPGEASDAGPASTGLGATSGAPEPEPPAKVNILPTAGLVAAGLGVVGLGIGGAFGLMAMSKNDEANSLCPAGNCPDQRGVALTDDARSAATASTVGFIAGGALVAGGLTLFFVAPKAPASKEASVAFQPILAPGGAGMNFRGTF